MDDRRDNRGGRNGPRNDGRGGRGRDGGERRPAGGQSQGRGDRPPRRDDRGQTQARGDRPPRRDDRSQGPGGGDRPPRRDDRGPTQARGDRPPRRDDRSQGPGGGERPPRRDDRSQSQGRGDRPPRREGGGDYRGDRGAPRGGQGDSRPPRRDDRDNRGGRDRRDDREARGDRGGYRGERGGDRPPRRDDRADSGPRRDDRGPRREGGDERPFRTREDREREDRVAREGQRGDRRDGRTHFRRPEGREPGRRERPGGSRRPVSVEVRSGGKGGGAQEGQHWIFGRHAVLAALNNPKRDIGRLVATEQMAEQAGIAGHALLEKATRADMDHMLARYDADATHGGIAAYASTLNPPSVESLLKPEGRSLVILLDQVSDPHNVGAVMRTAAAFGARAVIAPERNAAPVTGALARAASGALESVPYLRPTNLSRTLAMLKEWGYWRIGLDGAAEKPIEAAAEFERVALVLGAEGKGLRRLTAENCDLLVSIPMSDAVESLNVSNAAAIACYALYRRDA